MILDNKLYNIDDELNIQIKITEEGIYDITSITDTTVGVTGTRYFDKTFRVSHDNGKTFTSYAVLNSGNIAETFAITSSFYTIYELKYIRKGADTTGYLEFLDFSLNGTLESDTPKKINIHSISIILNQVL